MDYFILAHNQFVWDQVLDVIIGRPGYDNYLVAVALNNKISVIDATKTILTLHQTDIEGNDSGIKSGKLKKDLYFNYKLFGEFDKSRGRTNNTPFYTEHSQKTIELWQRFPKELVKVI